MREGAIVDRATGSEWNLLGQALRGPLQGRRLRPLAGGVHFAFAWLGDRLRDGNGMGSGAVMRH